MEESVVVARINDLSDLSRKLNQKSDTLNKIISSINTKLMKMNLGVEVWLENYPVVAGDKETTDKNYNPTNPHRWATLLGYCLVHDDWQLAVKDVTLVTKLNDADEEYEELTDPCDLKPLLEASREVRTEAMRLVPVLMDSIIVSAGRVLRSIEEAEKAADEL
jgi:hypothetical protein